VVEWRREPFEQSILEASAREDRETESCTSEYVWRSQLSTDLAEMKVGGRSIKLHSFIHGDSLVPAATCRRKAE